MEEPLVSVVCNTYNHASYIRETLDGILMQKTTFPYEVLVHDDASTDETADIIKEYEKKYPELIKPICQTQNQRSQKIKISSTIQYPRAKGRYIALCEGDDYWTDPQKLQRQFDALEAHPEVDMCAHGSIKLYPSGREVSVCIFDKPTIITTEEMISGGGLSLNTCTLMFRKTMLEKKWRFFEFWGYDYALKIRGSLRGGILCLPYNMAVYRFMSGPNAWTSRVLQDSKKEITHTEKRIQLLDYLNEDTDFRYDKVIQETKRKLTYDLLWYKDDYRTMCSNEYSDLYCGMSPKKQALVRLGCVCPGPVKLFHQKFVNSHLKGKL